MVKGMTFFHYFYNLITDNDKYGQREPGRIQTAA